MEATESKVTAVEFGKYLAIQRSGATNMFDYKVVSMFTGLSYDKIAYIQKHYAELLELYK